MRNYPAELPLVEGVVTIETRLAINQKIKAGIEK